MNNVIDFTHVLKEKRNIDLSGMIPYMTTNNLKTMYQIDEWDANLVKEAMFIYKFKDIYDEKFEDDYVNQMQFC